LDVSNSVTCRYMFVVLSSVLLFLVYKLGNKCEVLGRAVSVPEGLCETARGSCDSTEEFLVFI
jgi:hypothetical protein